MKTIKLEKVDDTYNVTRKAKDWWDSLPLQDIQVCEFGHANLVMEYYPGKTSCRDVTTEEIVYMYLQKISKHLEKE